MDGSVAIEANRQALKRIVAMLVDMAGLAEPARDDDKLAHVSDSPHSGLLRKQPLPLKGGEEVRPASPAPHPEVRAEGAPRRTIPRILWRAILALLRPAESAARRLIIAASRGIAIPPPRRSERRPQPQTMEPLLRRLGIAVTMAPGGPTPASGQAQRGLSAVAQRAKADGGGAVEPSQPRLPTFPLFDPPRRLALHGQRHRTVPPHAAPRICVPGITEPAHLPPPPSPDDLVSAKHVIRRLAALSAALDDLPGQARRFARWKASRDAQRDPATPRRLSPLRRGRPPGGRLSRYDPSITHPPNIREIDEILAHTHSLALYALESPDTS